MALNGDIGPILFPRPESTDGLLGCVSCSLGRAGPVCFPFFLSSDGGWLSRRDHSLRSSGPTPLTEVGVVCSPSPPLLVVLPVIFRRGKVCQSPVLGSQSALNSVLALQDLIRTLYRGYFYVP